MNGSSGPGGGGAKRGRSGPSLNPTGAPVTLQIDTTAEAVKTRFLQFLCGYGQQRSNPPPRDAAVDTEHTEDIDMDTDATVQPTVNYSHQAEVMRNTETSSLFVDFTHVLEFDPDLAHAIQAQYYRWEPYLRTSVFEFIRMEDAAYTINEDATKTQREFFVCFYNFQHVSHIRDLRTRSIGELTSFSGTVTRTSEVRPELLYGAFTCGECGGDTTGVEQQFKFTEPVTCQNPFCPNTSAWELNADKSVFVDWQRVKVQENSDEIPPGSMPRSIDVVLRHENVEQAKAGDRVVFTGALIVVPDVSKFVKAGGETAVAVRGARRKGGGEHSTQGMEGEGVRGLKALGVRELTYKTCFLACSVQTMEQRFNSISIRSEYTDNSDNNGEDTTHEPGAGARTDAAAAEMSQDELFAIQRMQSDPDRYRKMAASLCPSVYGHDEIRRGILLMLFGGVHKRTIEKIQLRGDINVCIVGDPSTAKSQFLKFICGFLPRAIYASGKVSSAAGLTASVTRDADSGDFCVEAGALMLADNGICCIDEFDKMDPMDQVAIHEAMEQQTISITKAGIQATLNARTSILAAANPLHGRYDTTKTLKANVNISAPIMSRFDLFFVIVDDCDEVTDERIAAHIVNIHMPTALQSSRAAASDDAYSEEELKRYIKFARTINPVITLDAKRMMVACYKSLRQNDVVSNGQSNIAYRITVRQLESMIRLAEALARLDLSDQVLVAHVQEAYRLLSKSIIHVDTENVELAMPVVDGGGGGRESHGDGIGNEGMDDQGNDGGGRGGGGSDASSMVTLLANSNNNNGNSNGTTTSSTSQTTTTTSQQNGDVSISFERFATIQRAVSRYIREKEDAALTAKFARRAARAQQLAQQSTIALDASDDDDEVEDAGVVQGEVVTWYLASQDITSEAQLTKEKRMICSVLDRLVRDQILSVVDLEDEEEQEEEQEETKAETNVDGSGKSDDHMGEHDAEEDDDDASDDGGEDDDDDADYKAPQKTQKKTRTKTTKKKKLTPEELDASKQARYLTVHPNYALD